MNAIIAAAIVKVVYSITLFQNLFCLLVISCTNIAIFFFSLSSLVVYTASSYLGLPSALHCYADTIGLLLDIPTCEGAVKQYFSIDST